jgi:hypothetical protein
MPQKTHNQGPRFPRWFTAASAAWARMVRPRQPAGAAAAINRWQRGAVSSVLCKRLLVHISQGLANLLVGHLIGLPSRCQDDLANGAAASEPGSCIARAGLASRIAIQHQDDFSKPAGEKVGLLPG